MGNLVCPVCDKTVGAQTCKEMKCEHCSTDLRLKFELISYENGRFSLSIKKLEAVLVKK